MCRANFIYSIGCKCGEQKLRWDNSCCDEEGLAKCKSERKTKETHRHYLERKCFKCRKRQYIREKVVGVAHAVKFDTTSGSLRTQIVAERTRVWKEATEWVNANIGVLEADVPDWSPQTLEDWAAAFNEPRIGHQGNSTLPFVQPRVDYWMKVHAPFWSPRALRQWRMIFANSTCHDKRDFAATPGAGVQYVRLQDILTFNGDGIKPLNDIQTTSKVTTPADTGIASALVKSHIEEQPVRAAQASPADTE